MSSVNNYLGYWRNVFNKILSVNNKRHIKRNLPKSIFSETYFSIKKCNEMRLKSGLSCFQIELGIGQSWIITKFCVLFK